MSKETKPWNSWVGMTEGDMVDELTERDVVQFEAETRDYWLAVYEGSPEQLRKAYWLAIGRHTQENDDAL